MGSLPFEDSLARFRPAKAGQGASILQFGCLQFLATNQIYIQPLLFERISASLPLVMRFPSPLNELRLQGIGACFEARRFSIFAEESIRLPLRSAVIASVIYT